MPANAARPRAVDYRIAPFDLHLLLAVQEQGSITAAAAAVSLSLPAASARIKALEFLASRVSPAPLPEAQALARHCAEAGADFGRCAACAEQSAHAKNAPSGSTGTVSPSAFKAGTR